VMLNSPKAVGKRDVATNSIGTAKPVNSSEIG
jgi:hypothetical protein